MIIRYIHIILIVCASVLPTWGQKGSSVQVMERFRAKMEEHAAFEVGFTLSGADEKGNAMESITGMIYSQKGDYAMLNPQVELYVCGDTKWLYTVDNNEAVVMRNDPASVDLAENPLALFSAQLSKEYKISARPNYFRQDGQEITEISLSPADKKTPYSSVLLRIHSQTLTPHSVKYCAKDGSWVEAVMKNFTPKRDSFPRERFIFFQKDHPGVYMTDLR